MIKCNSSLRDPIYYDANGNPRFRRCFYTDSSGVRSLAYPPHYCDGHTSTVYPNTTRTLWDTSTLQYKENSPECLGNKGCTLVFWPNGCNCYVSYNYDSEQFDYGANAAVVDYYGTVCLSVAKIADNALYYSVVNDLFNRYRNGTVGVISPSDYINSDAFVFQDIQHGNVVDELGNGQITGGYSHPYVSVELLLEVPTDFDGYIFSDTPNLSNQSNKRPNLVFEDYVSAPGSLVDIKNRTRRDWTRNGRRFILMDSLRVCGTISTSFYEHIFAPYVFFMDYVRTGTRTYTIHDMMINFRAVDSIRSGAT